ncbi:conjugal transfer protein TrbE [Candidatus Igneacidithiobacillus taiwanensis]|uniref:VirB4 family type IV secretion/conjugal transfer ATPase n=1 Tax=Candidatus Igneacidithiobacillus taiwanensis TaxID=1945924 RepID=UPI00289815C9|nr:conjugal transfer protein TrbE [Candidatus Igneacidithiobacillus taiwanensis]
MLNLKQYRDKAQGLPDLLNIAFLVDSWTTDAGEMAVALQKDGSFLAGFRYDGPDLESLSTTDLESLSALWNNALSRLGTDWGVHVSAIREPADGYIPEADNHFRQSVASLIDMERRAQYGGESHHFVTRYYMTIAWRTPVDAEVAVGQALVQKKARRSDGALHDDAFADLLARFRQPVEVILGLFRSRYRVRALDADGLLTHIHECLTGAKHPINAPRIPAYLDVLVGHHDFVGGLEPAIDGEEIRVVTAIGYPNVSYPEMLEHLHALPFPLRYTLRFLPLDQADAVHDMGKIRDKWFGSRQSLKAQLGEKLSGEAAGELSADDHVTNLALDAKQAINEAREGAVKFGFFALAVVLRSENEKLLTERVKAVKSFFDNAGYVAYLETVNTVEALLGSLPGHLYENIRRPILHSLNFADFAPKTEIWAGSERCPSPLMKMADGRKAPPLLYAATTGNTPFRLNLHVGDLGHTFIAGMTGGGKSTLLALLAAQWQRYQDARVIAFDKGMSLYTMTEALYGQHYDLNGPLSDLSFAPLQQVDDPAQAAFAADWIEGLVTLQGISVTSVERGVIRDAINALARESGRSLTHLVQTIQNQKLKDALAFYTLSGQTGSLLDAERDGLQAEDVAMLTFEMSHLMNGSPTMKRTTVPVLLYLFHRIEQMLDGKPTLILLDEAWTFLDDELFLAKLRGWLKELRKKNAVVVFATQSLADLKGNPLLPVLQESCPTKIFLPNAQAGGQQLRPLYVDMGLNDRQIELLAQSTPKQDYYLFTTEGQRRIQFCMGPVTLAFCGVSDPREVKRVAELKATHGQKWPAAWLRERMPAHRQDWAQALEQML